MPLVTVSIVLMLSGYALFRDLKPADLPAQAGDIGRISAAATACFELQDYRRVRELAGSDRAAAKTYAAQACGLFEPGLRVRADKVSETDSAVCARQVGLPQCFWISSEAFSKEHPSRDGG